MEKEFVREWLLSHWCCVIATSYEDIPWAATVNYKVDEELNLLISSRPDSLKYQNILKNPHVSVVIDSQNDEGTLQIYGLAEPVHSGLPEEPNLRVKPVFLTFLKKENTGEIKRIKLSL